MYDIQSVHLSANYRRDRFARDLRRAEEPLLSLVEALPAYYAPIALPVEEPRFWTIVGSSSFHKLLETRRLS
jgi:hypothetical protein